MRIETRQLRQTIISAGVVGAIFGLVPVLAILAFASEYGRHADLGEALDEILRLEPNPFFRSLEDIRNHLG